ncbi:tetratricopeptide repeat protein [Roseisalinus antarcticus]|nr:tetratricopeptide repeat protein [Roseisalinus antarcticus]
MALTVASGAALAQGQTRLSPEAMMTLAAETLDAGDAVGASVLADALLQRDPEDVPALILRAEAAIAMGDFTSGQRAAQRAWAAAEVEPARFASARLAALALSQQGAYTRAQFWLRRARQHAPNEATSRSVAEDYQFVRRQNPLSFRLDFSVSPTDNINNGTTNDTIVLPGLPFVFALSGDSKPLSGTEITAGGKLRYRIREGARSVTYAEVEGFARTYRLSSEALDQQPDAEGSDYAETQLSFGLGHIWLPEGGRDPWRFAIAHGRFWYGGDPWSDFTRLSVDRGVTLGPSDRLDFGLTLERLDNVEVADSESAGLEARWTHAFGEVGALTLLVEARKVTSDGLDRAYQSRAAGIGWSFSRIGASIFYKVEERDYEETAYLFDTRTDTRRTLRLSVPVPAVEFYGFSPVFTAERVITDSNVTRFETETTGTGITLRSAF